MPWEALSKSWQASREWAAMAKNSRDVYAGRLRYVCAHWEDIAEASLERGTL